MKSKWLFITLALGLGLTLALLWLLGGRLPARAAPGAELRVCPSGCTYSSIQAAVDAASLGDVIKVGASTYSDIHARAGVTQVVYISKTVTIRGGYTTTNWTTPNPDANPTTLDAQGHGRVLYITGDINPTLEGLRITGGNATGLGGDPLGRDAGGGVYAHTATVAINDCVIFSNTASTADWGSGYGGGLYLWSSSNAALSGNAVVSNTASMASLSYGGGFGGGLYLGDSDGVTLSGNTVCGNTASTTAYGGGSGGGLCLSESDNAALSGNTVCGNIASTAEQGNGGGLKLTNSDNATLTGNTIYSNTASTSLTGSGGGLLLANSDNATLTGNTIYSNTAGAAFWGYGGGLDVYRSNNAALTGNAVRGNTAAADGDGFGGGLYLSGNDDLTLSGNTVVSNTATLSATATGHGGGMYVTSSQLFTLTNNIVAGNDATSAGSGLWFGGNSWGSTSGQLFHATIANNSGSVGVEVSDYVTLTFTNTILSGHSVGITVTNGSTATLEATLWYGNSTDTGGAGTIVTGTRNCWGAPAFVDPDAGDYHITPGSAAIDKGVDAGVGIDIDNEPRFYGDPDLGADEYWPPGALKRVYLPLVLRSYPFCSLVNSDDFSDPTSGWPSQDFGVTSYGYSNGEYRWWSNYAGASVWFLRTFSLPGNDFTAEVDARLATDTDTPMGLKFNFSLEGGHTLGYVFEVRSNTGGQYRLAKSSSPVLIDWTATSDFNPYPNWNRLRVTRQGSNITLYLNGTMLATISDNDYLGSGFMMDLTTGSQVPAEVRYDNFALYSGVCP